MKVGDFVVLFVLIKTCYGECEYSHCVVPESHFPYPCPYVDSLTTNLTLMREIMDGPPYWYPIIRVTNMYYKGLAYEESYDKLFYNPLENGSFDCVIFVGEEEFMKVDCSANYNGLCYYQYTVEETCHNFCLAYNEICGTGQENCAALSNFPNKHACQDEFQNLRVCEVKLSNQRGMNHLRYFHRGKLGKHQISKSPKEQYLNETLSEEQSTTSHSIFTEDIDTILTKETTEQMTTTVEQRTSLPTSEICNNCDEVFLNYPSPEILLNLSSSELSVTITSYLKLKKFKNNDFISCVSDVKHTLSNYIYSFGEDFVVYEQVESPKSFIKYILIIKNELTTPTRIWCEAFEYPNMTLIKSNTLIIKPGNYGYDFTAQISSFKLKSHIEVEKSISESLTSINEKLVRTVELITTSNILNLTLILHITTFTKSMNLIDTFHAIKGSLDKLDTISCTYLRSSEYCLEEISQSGSRELHWPSTPIGQTIVPTEKCLQQNGNFVTRTCKGNYLNGTYWSEVTGKCADVKFSQITDDLYDLVTSNKSAEEVNDELYAIIKDKPKTHLYDVYLVAKLMERISSSDEFVSPVTFCKSVSSIMGIDINVLTESQINLGATDLILLNTDVVMNNLILNTSGSEETIFTENVMAKIVDLTEASTAAIIFAQGGNKIEVLKNITSLESIPRINLQFAIYFNLKLLEEIHDYMKDRKIFVAVVMYMKDSLFNENNQKEDSISWIPSIFIQGFQATELNESLQLIYKPNLVNHQANSCSHWQYETWFNEEKYSENSPYDEQLSFDEMLPNDKPFFYDENLGNEERSIKGGKWTYNGKPKKWYRFHLCEFSHMTHFGLLAGITDPVYGSTLDIITAIGCGLSVIGILGIVITAIVFDTWRNETGTKILLNISLVILMQMGLMYIGGVRYKGESDTMCAFIGASLHYCILSHSCWMLVVGYMQYQRLVLVFFKEFRNFVLYASILAWFLPILLVVPAAIVSPESYYDGTLCSLHGNLLYCTLFFPMGIVLSVNLVLFWEILSSMWCKKDGVVIKNHFKVQVRLVIFLFFLMGFTWIFGILAEIFEIPAFAYLFSLSGALQGFVLFMFCIALNEKTRRYWHSLVKRAKYTIHSSIYNSS